MICFFVKPEKCVGLNFLIQIIKFNIDFSLSFLTLYNKTNKTKSPSFYLDDIIQLLKVIFHILWKKIQLIWAFLQTGKLLLKKNKHNNNNKLKK